MLLSSSRGISLFESIAALTIVGLTSVSALAAVGAELRTAERARHAVETDALSAQRIDYLGLMTDAELQSLPDTVKQGTFPGSLSEYSWKTTSVPLADQSGVYDVAITILWPGSSYTVRTYVYRRPILSTVGR